MEYTYDQIKPLIHSESFTGQQMVVLFHAENLHQPIQGIGMMIPDQSQMMKSVGKSAVKRSIFSSIISSVSRLLGGAIGGVGGSIASSAASSVGYAAVNNQAMGDMMKVDDTPENRQKAVLMAFDSVKSFFEWDDSSKSWKGKDFNASTPKTN